MFVPSRVPVRRTGLFLAVACSMLLPAPAFAQSGAASTPIAQTEKTSTIAFDIPAQNLEDALIRFSRQSRQELFFADEDVAGKTSTAINGRMTSIEAINMLLDGTGLAFERTASGGMMVGDPATLNTGNTSQAGGTPPPRNDAALVARAGAASSGSASNSPRNTRVEEVYVTARKREESVQEVPISITAFSAADLKAAGIRSLADMEGIVPGLNMGGGGNGIKKDSNPYIRGVGQRETKVTLDPAVGTYIDGIYIARTAGAMLDTVGVERIEVLRGPQGTLFGKNTTGGAIAITTTKPHETFGGSVGVNVGNYGRSDATAMLNVPILENKLFGRLSVSSKNSEGTFTNVLDNVKWNNDNRITAIGQLRWLPTENVTADLLVERTRIRERPRPQKCQFIREPGFLTTQTAQLGGGLTTTYEDACQASFDLPDDKFSSDMSDSSNESPLGEARYWVDTTTVGGTVVWDIGDIGFVSDLSMKSISAWRKTETIADEDLDAIGGTEVPFGLTGGDRTSTPVWLMRAQPDFTETTQFSQEFQLSGRALNDRLFFSTGLYYFEEETPQDDLILSAGLAQQEFDALHEWQGELYPYYTMAFEASYERLETDNKAYAWFGQVDFDITPQLQLTAGLRYTREKRWSRYSKGALHMPSMLYNMGYYGGSQTTGIQAGYHNTPGFKPIDQWTYGTCVSPSGDTACNTVAEANNSDNFVSGILVGDEANHKSDAWTPMVSLKYNFSDELLSRLNMQNTMIYATYSEGYHSGGVTAGAADQNRNGTADPVEFDPEKVKNYEVGFKTTAFDRRLQANIAAFYMDYTDMQITSAAERAGIPVPFIENVGKSTIQGVEAEFTVFPTANWRVMLSASYTKAEFKEWDAVIHQLGLFGGINQSTTIDRSDEPMPRVPKWQAYLLTDYTIPFADGSTLTPSIAFRYMSEIYHGFDRGSYCYTTGGVCERSPYAFTIPMDPPGAVLEVRPGAKDAMLSEPTVMVDARISWLSSDQRMEIALWGKNLTNKTDYLVGGMGLADVQGAVGRIYADPRTFGLEMTYRFGAE